MDLASIYLSQIPHYTLTVALRIHTILRTGSARAERPRRAAGPAGLVSVFVSLLPLLGSRLAVEHGLELIGRFLLHVREHVTVGVEREPSR